VARTWFLLSEEGCDEVLRLPFDAGAELGKERAQHRRVVLREGQPRSPLQGADDSSGDELDVPVSVGDRALAEPHDERAPPPFGQLVAPRKGRLGTLCFDEAALVGAARGRISRQDAVQEQLDADVRRAAGATARHSPFEERARCPDLELGECRGCMKERVHAQMLGLSSGDPRRGFPGRNGATEGQQIGGHRTEHEGRVVVRPPRDDGVPEEVHASKCSAVIEGALRERAHALVRNPRRPVEWGSMPSWGLTTAVLAATLAISCAHNHRNDPDVIREVRGHRDWMDRLPSCSPEVRAQAIGAEALRRDALDRMVVVRGFLELGSGPSCTQMACDAECCNRCSGAWVVVSRGGPSASGWSSRELPIQSPGEGHPMAWNAMDCQVITLRDAIPKQEVIVTGTFQGEELLERLVDATLCVVR
jgi:hypothetical protein